MEQQEIDNETTAVAPPPDKPEKPKRAPRKKAAAPVEEPVETTPEPVIEAKPEESDVAVEEPVDEPEPAIEAKPTNGNGSAPASARQQQQPAAETLDIRILKEMKLPDLSKLAKE